MVASNPPDRKTWWRFQWVKVHGGGRSLWYERSGSGYRLFIVKGRRTKVDVDNWLRIAKSTYDRRRRRWLAKAALRRERPQR